MTTASRFNRQPCAIQTFLPGAGRGIAFLLLSAALLSGCAVTPRLITAQEQQALVAADTQSLFAEVEPVTGPISLEEAIARALKYNLEHRLSLMEEVLRHRQTDLASLEMLPRLAANAGWVTRSNENLTLSRNTATGATSVDPTVSQDRTRRHADLTLTWNLLDFGVSYYQAHQNADQALIAQERRRRVVNQIVQQVRAAYWKAATAEPLARELAPLIAEARGALEDARLIETRRLSAPLEILQYQKGLVEVIRDLETLERDLAVAKAELASLMGLSPGTAYSLAPVAAEAMKIPRVSLELEDMETLALLNRPEMREEAYQRRITALEARKALLRLLPGLSLHGALQYDSNSYLINSNWAEAGARVTWNLLNLVSAPTTLRVAKAQEQVGEVRRLALAMAALTQVHVGYQNYVRSTQLYEQAQLLGDIEQRIFKHVENAAESQAQSPLQRIRARMSAAFAEVGRYRAYAEMQGAVANLFVSIGLDPLPEAVEAHDLETLKRAIGKALDYWNQGHIQTRLLDELAKLQLARAQ
ncbi:TolC family protein [Geoalkalibacter sp.]|uniref:TolC family protein n=1 Tax=Geoalkalibacter sp. TaxID=3041440 RepID=UPI00272DDC75|nr:TolC family protein [Geoalkalibacter sp.]